MFVLKCFALSMFMCCRSGEGAVEAGSRLAMPSCNYSGKEIYLGPHHYAWRADEAHRPVSLASTCTYWGVIGTTIHLEDDISYYADLWLRGSMLLEGNNRTLSPYRLHLGGKLYFSNFSSVYVPYSVNISNSSVEFYHSPVRTQQAHQIFSIGESYVMFKKSPVTIGGYWNSQMWMIRSRVTFADSSLQAQADDIVINASDVRFTGVHGFVSSGGECPTGTLPLNSSFCVPALLVQDSNLTFQRGWGAIVTRVGSLLESGLVRFQESNVSFEENCTKVRGGAVQHEGGYGDLMIEGGSISCFGAFAPPMVLI